MAHALSLSLFRSNNMPFRITLNDPFSSLILLSHHFALLLCPQPLTDHRSLQSSLHSVFASVTIAESD